MTATTTPGQGTIRYYRDRNNFLVTAVQLGREDWVTIREKVRHVLPGQWVVSKEDGQPISIWSDSEFRKNFHETR